MPPAATGQASPREAGSSSLVFTAVVAVALFIYSTAAIVFLVRDFETVSQCHASSMVMHAVWETNLWTYVLISLLFTLAGGALLLSLPAHKVVDVFRRQLELRSERRATSKHPFTMEDEFDRVQRRKARFGIMDDLPDWIFLLHGMVMLSVATVTAMLALFGYFELYVAKPWCEDRRVAFEEMDLFHFARVTFFMQIGSTMFFAAAGVLFWTMPFLFELTDPDQTAPLVAQTTRRNQFH